MQKSGRINEVIIIRLANTVRTDRWILTSMCCGRTHTPKQLDPCQICKRIPVSGHTIVRTTELRNWSLNHIECVSRGLNFHISINEKLLSRDIFFHRVV